MSATAPIAPTRLHRPAAPDRPSSAVPEVTTMSWAAEDRRLQVEWLDLAARLGASYFTTPDWVLTWWRHQGRPETTVTTWRDDRGRLVALVPLSRTRVPVVRRFGWTVEVAATAGTGAGDAHHTAWLVHATAVDAVRAWAGSAQGGRALLLRGVSAGAAGPLPPDAEVFDEVRCPRLTIPDDIGDLPGSSSFRRKLRRDRRRLADRGVTLSWLGPGALGPEALWTLRHLHLLRREALGPAADVSAFDDGTVQLHAALATLGHTDRGPVAVVARRGASTIGMLYGMRWCDTFAFVRLGWDPAWARLGLGTTLIHEAIRMAGAHGATTFDFLRGDEPDTYRFGATDVVDRTWYTPRGPAGRALQAATVLRGASAAVRRRDGG